MAALTVVVVVLVVRFARKPDRRYPDDRPRKEE
jgi:hypothetical protein